jgi:nucleoside-diphosphate-sugar epimerase
VTRVLVTGASGFVGFPVVTELARRGHDVHAITSRTAPAGGGGVTWHQGDLAARGGVDALVAGIAPEALVHAAWYVEPGRFWTAVENVDWVGRSLSLLRAFVAAGGRRAVLLGTCAEYDWTEPQEFLAELGSPLGPATLYGSAKDGLRRVAGAYAAQAEIELAWGRLFFLYGPREQPARLVPAVVRSLLRGESVATTSGAQVRDLLHVDDVAGAIVALLESAAVGPVNIASGSGVTLREVIGEVAALVGRPELVRFGELPERPGEPERLVADVTRLRAEVGYHPRLTLAEGLAATVEWWRSA